MSRSRKFKKPEPPKSRSGVARGMILAGMRGTRIPHEKEKAQRRQRHDRSWSRDDWGDEPRTRTRSTRTRTRTLARFTRSPRSR